MFSQNKLLKFFYTIIFIFIAVIVVFILVHHEIFGKKNYYGFFIAFGFLLSMLSSYYMSMKRKIPFDFFLYFFPVLVFFAFVGFRGFAYIFEGNKNKFFTSSGFSIQGGVVFAFLGTLPFAFWYYRRKRVSILVIMDITIVNILLGQAVGRWGNFFNSELLGSPLSNTFKELKEKLPLLFPNWFWEKLYKEGKYHHPLFLYESLLNLFGWFLIVFVLDKITIFANKSFYSYSKSNLELFNTKKLNLKKETNNKKFIYFFKYIMLYWRFSIYFSIEKTFNTKLKTNKENIVEWNCKKLNTFIFSSLKINTKFFPKAGTRTSLYFIWYGIIRFCLDFIRDDGKFIENSTIDVGQWVSVVFVIFGLLFLLYSNFIAYKFFRKNNYQYEIKYLVLQRKIIKKNIKI